MKNTRHWLFQISLKMENHNNILDNDLSESGSYTDEQ
jgi:hypothetical protein